MPVENMNIKVNLGTVFLEISMNGFFKFKTIKKIIKARFLAEYNLCPIFIIKYFITENSDLKPEMFYGEIIKGYLMNKNIVDVRAKYGNDAIELMMKNYYRLGK